MSQLRNRASDAAIPIATASSAFLVPGLLLAGGATVLGSLVLEGAWAGAMAALVVSSGAFLVQKWNGSVRPSDALVDNMPCAGLIVNADGSVLRANAATEHWFGKPANLPAALVAMVQHLVHESASSEFTVKVDSLDGRDCWMHCIFRLGAEDHRRGRRVAVLSLTDVSAHRAHTMERARLQREVALSEARLQVYSDTVADAVITCGPDGVLRSWSSGSDRLLGYKEVGGLSRHVSTFASEFEVTNLDGSPVAVQDWPASRLLRGEDRIDMEVLVRRLDDGSLRRLRYRGGLVRAAGGEIVELVIGITDHRALANLARAQSQAVALLNVVTDHEGEAVFALDRSGALAYANATAKSLIGRSAGTKLELQAVMQGEAEGGDGIVHAVMEAAATGRPSYTAAEVDGARWSVAGRPYMDEHGTLLGALGWARLQPESSTGVAVRNWLDLVLTPSCICNDEIVTYVNQAFIDSLGGGITKDYLGKRLTELFVREDQAEAGAWLRSASLAADSGKQFRLQRGDGTALVSRMARMPCPEAGGAAKIVSLYSALGFPASLAALQSLIGCLQDAVPAADRSGAITWASDAGCAMFGYFPGEMVGQRISSLMPEALRYVFRARFAEHASGREVLPDPCVRHELVAQRKDGTYFPVSVSVGSCLVRGVRVFTAVIRDLSSFKQLEAKFLQAQKMEAIGRLTGGVVHDFNNLLTVINGHCELLRDQSAPEEVAAALTTIQEAGRRAAALTRYLLAFSRKATAELKVVDVNEVIRISRPLMVRLIGEDIRLTLDLQPEPMRILVDPSQLDQALMNLVVNARDAMQAGGTLTIETRVFEGAECDTGRAVQIAIRDTGSGMSEDVQKRLFEPFFTTKSSGKGTGLGLSVVHRIVTEHHGSVRVSSALGKGTTFYLSFPMLGAEAKEAASAMEVLAPRGSGTVLLVEDDAAVRAVARALLSQNGYSVLEAANGVDAIAIAKQSDRPIDLLLTDIVMPDMSGTKLVQSLRQASPGLRSIYMTGYTEDALQQHGVVRGEDSVLHKPFTQQQLLQAVQTKLATQA